MTIRKLPEQTIGQIAAGEVIERPAAAVKELVENAIDAGASRIDVEIAGGGISAIEVRDNGCGIALAELTLAVERHATSKLAAIDDLTRLTTLGFRGEGLASLAAVSDLRIQTLATGERAGSSLEVRYGEVGTPRQVTWGGGTAIVARDLFENVPARRKFLRQESTEAGYVQRAVGAYALAYPRIAFSLTVDGRRVFTTDGRGDRIGTAVAIWGGEVASALVELMSPDDLPPGFAVHGIVSLPDVDRATRQQQLCFAQGRLIASRQLGTALEQAYHTLLMVARHPIACLLVTVPADRIDVNVHPTKAEVRFADERLVFAMVQRAVRAALVEHAHTRPVPVVVASPIADDVVQRRMALMNPARPWNPVTPVERQLPDPAPVAAAGRTLPVLRVLGQIANMFVIAEGPDGMYLIDQHAAHERILFEQLFTQYEARAVDRQLLLHPPVLRLAPQEEETLQRCAEELDAFGFGLEEFGPSTVRVTAVPSALKVRDVERTLRLILEEMATGGRGMSRLESLAISAACHTSIRAGQPLSLLEMRELVVQLEACSSPLACGHGRPTMLRMTAEELERQFQRR